MTCSHMLSCLAPLSLLALFGSSCQTFAEDFASGFEGSQGEVVTVPASDVTPPKVTLTIFSEESPIVLDDATDDVVIAFHPDDIIVVRADVDDPEGAKAVHLPGESTTVCHQTDGDLGTQYHAQLLPGLSRNVKADGTSFTRIWHLFVVDSDFISCPSGSEQTAFSITLRAVGENFHGLSTTTSSATFVASFN